ncbi:MAG: hypothetical protein IKA00_11200 [Prevotella sp.]|nr:hypothetical protein [Prevotella sp.]
MADNGFLRPWLHWSWWPFSGFNNMFTQPLLFDDSLTLLQKVAMLWKKLHDLIEQFDEFTEDFETWKGQVESALTDLTNALEELQECCATMQAWKPGVDSDIEWLKDQIALISGDIADINAALDELGDVTQLVNQVTTNTTDITNLQQTVGGHTTNLTTLNTRVTQLGNDITSLTSRVSTNETDIANIKNALNRLDIQLPIALVDDTNFNEVSESWYDWIAAYCDSHAGNATGTFKGIWTKTDDIQPGIAVPHPVPAKSLTIGKLGQNLVLCKMPLIVYAPLTQSTLRSNEAACITEVLQKITSTGLDKLLVDGLNASQESFFEIPLLEPYPYVIDESKFQTSYMCFCYGANLGTPDISNLYSLSIDSAGNKVVNHANCINMDVRIQLTKDAANGYMQVLSNEIYFLIYNGYVAVCFLAENA